MFRLISFVFLGFNSCEFWFELCLLQKSFIVKYVQGIKRVSMSDADDSLQVILDNILRENVSDGIKLTDSALDEEIRSLIRSRLADMLLEKLRSSVLDKLLASKEIEGEFEAAVLRTWKKPFDLLDLLLYICLEVASEFNCGNGSEASSDSGCVRVALVRQQANACLVFNEVVHLLRSGFPGGAHSRWRKLHEIACVSYFISRHGEDVARRFLDYEVVEAYFQAEAIREHQQKMNCGVLSEKDFRELKREFGKVEKVHGSDFVKKAVYPFGWVPREVLETRSLREIERSVGLDLLRPYYDSAVYNVYGESRGLLFRLGVGGGKGEGVVLPVGPSNYGLADPGKAAAISLGQVTACLLQAKPSVKGLVIVECLRNLVDEISEAFCEVEAEFTK